MMQIKVLNKSLMKTDFFMKNIRFKLQMVTSLQSSESLVYSQITPNNKNLLFSCNMPLHLMLCNGFLMTMIMPKDSFLLKEDMMFGLVITEEIVIVKDMLVWILSLESFGTLPGKKWAQKIHLQLLILF